jgi:hypothetical protein
LKLGQAIYFKKPDFGAKFMNNGLGRNNLKKNVVTEIIKNLERGTAPVLAIFRKPSMLSCEQVS